MNDIVNLRDTITPKSDQLNADDLIGMEKVITVTGVRRGNNESPLFINYQGDDGRPFKPCKSMRRILIFSWGENGNDWIGKSMRLYCDPSVKYAGKEVGGIRISAVSGISKPINVKLTATRGSKKAYKVDVLQEQEKPPYPADRFNKAIDAMRKSIEGGQFTPEQVITRCELTGNLSDEQRAIIRKIGDGEEPSVDEEDFFND